MKLFGKEHHSFRILRKYQKIFFLTIFCTIFSTGFEAVSIGLTVPLLNTIINNNVSQESQGWLIDHMVTLVQTIPNQNLFWSVCLLFIAATVLKVIFTLTRDVYKVVFAQTIRVECQKEMYAKQLNSDLAYLIKNKGGDLFFRATQLPHEVSTYFTLLPSIIIEGITVCVISLLLLSISWKLFMIVVTVGFIFMVIIAILSQGIFKRIGTEYFHAQSKMNVIIHEALAGAREIISFAKRQQWINHFMAPANQFLKLKVQVTLLRQIPGSVLELIAVIAMCAVGLIYGLDSPQEIRNMLPVLAMFALAIVRMIPSINKISQERTQLASLSPALKKYEHFYKEKTSHIIEGSKDFQEFKDNIQCRHVSFSYGADKDVFTGLNLAIPKHKTVAFVGGSGSGKTTLIDLLLGLYQPTNGAIMVDGIDLNEYRFDSWRDHIGVVPQNSTIFNASIRENISLEFGSPDLEKVKRAAVLAGIHEYIESLKDGYDTLLGDRGFKFSGGQRQRIAIARALYRDPDILIFDEATSALDYRTEKAIVDSMTQQLKGKTMIVLAHRLSTIEHADIIYVLKDGKVLQSGTHDELRSQKGEYAELYNRES